MKKSLLAKIVSVMVVTGILINKPIDTPVVPIDKLAKRRPVTTPACLN